MGESSLRLFVDDVRPAPEGWILVTSEGEAIRHLLTGRVAEISLDHDLGSAENGSGYGVAVFIEAGAHAGGIPRLRWSIHSSNPVGRERIAAAMASAERAWSRRWREVENGD